MFLTRFSLGCSAAALLIFSAGCVNHTRVLYQPKPFKRATVPASAAASSPALTGPGVERPAITPPTTGAAEGVASPSLPQ